MCVCVCVCVCVLVHVIVSEATERGRERVCVCVRRCLCVSGLKKSILCFLHTHNDKPTHLLTVYINSLSHIHTHILEECNALLAH